MLKPLDEVGQTIELIARVADAPVSEVKTRLGDEAKEIGTNVYRYLTEQKIPMYTASEALDTFYRENDSFLYETTVWNTCQAKQNMRDFVQSRLVQHLPRKADVFCVGDGLGFDSTWLALNGHQVRYFEPSLRCQEYAREVFSRNEVSVTELQDLEDIKPGSLDVVVCLDVLEHVPQPQTLVKKFHEWLKPDGLLFVHAPFWCLHWTRSTHLKENRHLSGDLKTLYTDNGFTAVDASVFWDPILLQKSDNPSPYVRSVAANLRIHTGRHLLRAGRWNSTIHNAIARFMARPPKWWRDALK